jgi:cell division protein FtsB
MNRHKRSEKIISMAKAKEKRRERRVLQKSVKASIPKRKLSIFAYRKFYAAIAVALLIAAGFYTARIAALKTDEERAVTEYEAALDKKARLETELEYIDDPVYIEQQARTRLRMVKPGEIYYVLPGQDGGPGGDPTGSGASAPEDEAGAE